ncbi:MAG: hypothetical protein OIN66_11370 [Candidatus Methanoperedens sp.]|nr:hypothetical protein [Candidatus Methanoperedens sp.]
MSWLDAIPVISAILAIMGLSLKAGRILQKLDQVIEDVTELKQDLKDVKAELQEHGERLMSLEISHMINGK